MIRCGKQRKTKIKSLSSPSDQRDFISTRLQIWKLVLAFSLVGQASIWLRTTEERQLASIAYLNMFCRESFCEWTEKENRDYEKKENKKTKNKKQRNIY